MINGTLNRILRGRGIGFLFVLAVLIAGGAGLANAYASVEIRDDAQVLSAGDKASITEAANNTSLAMEVWTSSQYTDKEAFYSAVQSRAANSSNRVVVGVDPVHKWSHISAARNTGLSATDVGDAQSAANQQFTNKNWGAGLTAAITRMTNVAPASGSINPQPAANPQPAGGITSGLGGLFLCLIPLVLIVAAFFYFRNRMQGNRFGNQTMNPSAQNPNQPQGYGQGNNQPNQPYGQGYNQGGSGMGGALGAGAIGALGGGLLGYGLGRNQGEAQANEEGNANAQDTSGGDYSGGTIDSPSGGSGADFGDMGGSDFGGGDFGGGDFGGGDF